MIDYKTKFIDNISFNVCTNGCAYTGVLCPCDLCKLQRAKDARLQELQSYQHLRWLGVDREHAQATLKNFIGEVIAVSRYKFDGFMFISSPNPGNGKTHLAVGLLKKFLYHNPFKDGHLYNWYDLAVQIMDNSPGHRSEYSLLDELKIIDLLILDDVAAHSNQKLINDMYVIINSRYISKKPTIITSNLTFEEFAIAYGAKVADRLRCGDIQIINGESRRK